MAIDTQSKRRSVLGYALAYTYPVADGTVGTADRIHAAGLYAGTTADPPPVVVPDTGRRRRRLRAMGYL
jgi:hypothetical protein